MTNSRSSHSLSTGSASLAGAGRGAENRTAKSIPSGKIHRRFPIYKGSRWDSWLMEPQIPRVLLMMWCYGCWTEYRALRALVSCLSILPSESMAWWHP